MGVSDLATIVQEEFNVSRVHGGNLGVVMGRLLFPNLSICIAELVSNSYDADATQVTITYDAKADLLAIEDDGEGMDKDGLQHFFRIGDSAKLAQPVSKKRRQRIGRYGVATLVLRKLAHRYQLQTSHQGMLLSLEETFSAKDRDETPIAVRIEQTDPERHGTIIRMRELRFSSAYGNFNVDALRKMLAVEMPISQDFSVYVNGDLIKSRSIPANVAEYLVEVNDHLIGTVSGVIYSSPNILPEGEAGIYIKVRGRAVGGSNLNIFGLNAGVASRVFGVIHADALVDIVGFDRSKFVEDPKFDRLRDYLQDILKQVRQDLDVDVGKVKRDRAKDMLGKTVREVEKSLSRLLGGGSYTILFDDEKAGAVAHFDRESRLFQVNPNSSALALPSFKETDVRRALLDAVKHALTRAMISNEVDRTAVDEFARGLPSLLGYKHGTTPLLELVEMAQGEKELGRMSPDRLYTFAEVTKVTGYRNMVLKRMVEAKLLNLRNEKLLWREVSQVVEKLHHRIPLVDLVQKMYPAAEAFDIRQAKEQRAIKRLDELARDSFPSYVVNIAGKGNTFYAVENSGIDTMRQFIELDQAKAVPQALGMFINKRYAVVGVEKGYGAVVYTLEQSGKMSFNHVQLASSSILGFIEGVRARDLGRLVKRASYYFLHSETYYVVGICVLHDIKEIDILGSHFERNGFEERSIAKDLIRPLYNGVEGQRARVLPIVETTKDLEHYIEIVNGFRNGG